MQIDLPKPVLNVLQRLEDAGFEAWTVGGCVRDSLLGRVPPDYDVAASARPEETRLLFSDRQVLETGMKHGTVTVLSDGMPVEVTTFRVDGDYNDRRHPRQVTFTASLEEDLARRDFTVNAMAWHPKRGLADPFGGQRDLQAGILRCVGDADRRFREDALRILRGLRFASVLGLKPDPAAEKAAFANRLLLKEISAERVAAEFVRLLCGPNVRRVLLDGIGILGAVMPEAAAMQGFEQHSPYHRYDVLTHTAAAVEAVPPEPVLRLAAFFHDIGKPDCFSADADGTGHFYGHDARSAELADAILSRLRFDNATRERTVQLVRLHGLQILPEERAVRRALNRLGPETFRLLLCLKEADCIARGTADVGESLAVLRQLRETAAALEARNACFSLKDLAVNGSDLIRAGMQPGKRLGRVLNALLEAVIAEEVPNEREALLLLAARLDSTEEPPIE